MTSHQYQDESYEKNLKESGYHLPRYCIILSGASIHPSLRPGARILEKVPLDNTLPLKSLSFLQRNSQQCITVHPSLRPGARILEKVPLDNTLPLKSLSFLQRK